MKNILTYNAVYAKKIKWIFIKWSRYISRPLISEKMSVKLNNVMRAIQYEKQ